MASSRGECVTCASLTSTSAAVKAWGCVRACLIGMLQGRIPHRADRMSAHNPTEVHSLFGHAFNLGDVGALIVYIGIQLSSAISAVHDAGSCTGTHGTQCDARGRRSRCPDGLRRSLSSRLRSGLMPAMSQRSTTTLQRLSLLAGDHQSLCLALLPLRRPATHSGARVAVARDARAPVLVGAGRD